MPPKRKGSLATFTGADGRTYFRGRIRLADKTREWINVPDKMNESRARDWLEAMQEKEDKLGLLYRAKLERQGQNVDGEKVPKWCERWIEERRTRGLTSVDTDEGRLREHVFPILREKVMARVTTSDVEDVRDALDAKVRAAEMKWKTALNTWGLVTKMFDDARSSKRRDLRVRDDDPTAGVKPTERGARTAKVYLYPDEFLQLVSCERIPVRWRRLYAIDTYQYLRAAEVKGLDWPDADLDREVMHVHKTVDRRTGVEGETKTSIARRLPIEKELLPLLKVMKEEATGPRVIGDLPETDRKLARQLRIHLERAGITRTGLLKGTATSKALTFHDLRATGITWCAVRGDDPMRLMQRAGHTTFSTTQTYIREAENLGRSIGQVFPPLPASLLVRAKDRANDQNGSGKTSGAAGNRNRRRSRGRADSSDNSTVPPAARAETEGDKSAIGGAIGPRFGPNDAPQAGARSVRIVVDGTVVAEASARKGETVGELAGRLAGEASPHGPVKVAAEGRGVRVRSAS